MAYKKRIAIVALLMVALLAYFWLGSRYPGIDEKAAMAGEVVMEDVLSFEATLPVDPADPLWRKIGYSTVNWVMTNRQGMTFGVLFASLVLTMPQLWPKKPRPKKTMRDILRGVLVGAPMGVCVNCAAPIAYGMHKEGANKETSLAVMFASPTLNIIVLAMVFSILPLYMAVTKLVATFIFLLVFLPLLTRFGFREPEPRAVGADVVTMNGASPLAPEAWVAAFRNLARNLPRNFLFIVIRTVPLMFLAGFLGATMANLLPMDSFSQWQVTLGAMAGVALLGTFAPVPIAFDVVVVQALLAAGMPAEFATVLLVTLGMFSVYPLLLVSRMLSLRFSLMLFFAVAALGLGTGYFAGFWGNYQAARAQAVYQAHFAGRYQDPAEAVAPVMTTTPAAAMAGDPLVRQQTGQTILEGDVRVESFDFAPRSAAGELPFSSHPGRAFGLAPLPHQVLDLMVPFSQGRGLASGDFDADGWPDLAVANNRGIALYRNIGGSRFEEWPLNIPQLDRLSTLTVAFADLDNDGCQDLFVGAFGDVDYVLVNDCAGFVKPSLAEVPHENGLMTQAAAFADVDLDGDLDILKGNWFFLIPRTAPSERATNYLAENLGGLEFRQQPLDEITGYTLALLFSDFDADGDPDMIIGNDYMEPDIYYRGDGKGAFEGIPAGDVVPVSTLATMSIDSADFDNDLDLDLYLTGKVNDFSIRRDSNRAKPKDRKEMRSFVLQRRKNFQTRYCAQFADLQDKARCDAGFANRDRLIFSSLEDCRTLPDLEAQDECMIAIRIKDSLVHREWSFCSEIPAEAFPVHHQMCEAYADYNANSRPKKLGDKYLDQGAIDQKMQGNVLLVQEEDGRFTEMAEELGVYDAHWAWSGKFADLDQDGWQDLFVVNGWWLETSMYSNDFFRNLQGRGFERLAIEYGLENKQKQCCYTYIDLDRDGDLDIISRSLDGGFDVYLNGMQDHHSVMFEFRDERGNRSGIGTKVTIRYGENGEHRQMREIKLSGGFVSFDVPFARFGLGQYDRLHGITVTWPDGEESAIDRVFEAGKSYLISRLRQEESESSGQ